MPRLREIFLKESIKNTDSENGDIGRLQGLHGLSERGSDNIGIDLWADDGKIWGCI